MSETQPRYRNNESFQGREEEEAQSQLAEALCHAEQPLQLLSLLVVLLRAWNAKFLKSWIQMQQGYCGQAQDYGL